MDAHRLHKPKAKTSNRLLHSICQRTLGFLWMFSASMLLVIGSGLAMLGVGGHLLVRAIPDTGNVINYDPSTVASFSPLPLLIGMVMMLGFALRARRLGR